MPTKIEVSENIHFLTSCDTFIASRISVDSADDICSNFNLKGRWEALNDDDIHV